MKTYKKAVPERTCIACRQVKSKKDLTRLVCTVDGVVVDATGKKAGRGAYLCKKIQCWEIGLKGNRVEHALKVTLSEDNRQQLMRFAGDLLPEERLA